MSLKYTNAYYNELLEFMNTINSNVNWSKVLNELLTLPIEKILTKLKVYVWSDKDLASADVDPVVRNTYLYYTKWIYRLFDDLMSDKVGVVIIDKPVDGIDNDTLNEKMTIKINVLKSLLETQLISYRLSADEDVETYISEHEKVLLFPTGLVLYPNAQDVFNQLMSDKITLIDDGYYNLYSTSAELEFDMFRLLVIELVCNPSANVEELLSNKYGMVQIKNILTLQ